MRIAMIGIRGLPARSGGAERVVEELSVRLAGRGHEMLVYSRHSYTNGQACPAGIQRIFTPALPGKHLETISHCATALVDVLGRKVDLVHLHSPGPALLSWLPALASVPVVLTIHADDWDRTRWSSLARWALRQGLATGGRCAREITAVSQPLATELAARLGRTVEYIPNGVNVPAPADASAVIAAGLQPGRFALWVGRIVPEKRLDLLLRAWAKVGGDWPLAVIGPVCDGAYGRLCRELADRANVRMLGERWGQELQSFYQNCGFAVLPSQLEGMSLVLLEAAAAGCSILAADIPANVSALGDSILYFKCNNETDLQGRISQLIRDESLRRQLGQSARLAVPAYDWSASARRFEQVYQRALGPRERS